MIREVFCPSMSVVAFSDLKKKTKIMKTFSLNSLCFVILSIKDQVALLPVCWITLWIPWVFACLQRVLSSHLNVPTAPWTDSVVFILECAITDNQ